MNKEKLMENLKSVRYNYTDDACSVVENVIDYYEDDSDIYDLVWQETDDYMIYYSDAFDYLKHTNTTEFKEAIDNGYGENVCTIATYYLEQEVYDLLRDIDFDF